MSSTVLKFGPATLLRRGGEVLPGLLLVAMVTAAAYGLRQMPGLSVLSPMIWAILIGIAIANVTGVAPAAHGGIALSGKKLLRLSVALLGLQLTVTQLGDIGLAGLLVIGLAVVSTYCFTLLLGKVMGVHPSLTRLIAAGTSICGASAIAAANAVERAREDHVTYAVAGITLFGTAAMFLLPIAGVALGLDPLAFGLWSGASVHEVAQVVAAGYQAGPEAGDFAVAVKLTRVLTLAPMLILVGLFLGRSRKTGEGGAGGIGFTQALPLFVLAFLALVLANSFALVPAMIREPLVEATPVMLTAALGALGLNTRFAQLGEHGLRPMALAGIASLFIAGVTLGLITLLF